MPLYYMNFHCFQFIRKYAAALCAPFPRFESDTNVYARSHIIIFLLPIIPFGIHLFAHTLRCVYLWVSTPHHNPHSKRTHTHTHTAFIQLKPPIFFRFKKKNMFFLWFNLFCKLLFFPPLPFISFHLYTLYSHSIHTWCKWIYHRISITNICSLSLAHSFPFSDTLHVRSSATLCNIVTTAPTLGEWKIQNFITIEK